MLSTLQAFLLITSSLAAPSSNQSEAVGGQQEATRGQQEAPRQQEGKTATNGDLNTTQPADPHPTEVANSTTDAERQSKNSSTDYTIDSGGQRKNSSDNNKNNNNIKADPLAMMPESLIGAGDKARLWLNQNNQMVSCIFHDNCDAVQ